MRLTSYLTALPRDISFVKSLSLSYIYIITYIFKKIKKDLLLGGEDGSRTHDLLNAIQTLSQLSYNPILAEGRISYRKRFEPLLGTSLWLSGINA